MADTGMTLQVSQELVRPVIESKIQAAIVAELSKSDGGDLIGQVVSRVLTQKVDGDGKATDSTYQQRSTFMEWMVQKAVRECAAKAMAEWLAANKSRFEKHFAAELGKRSAGMARVFVEGLEKSIASQWSFKVDVGFNSPEKR